MRHVLQGRAGLALTFIIGLVIGGAATAGATSIITGKQIRDGSITERDLASALRGKIGRPGTAGPAGPKGDAGTAGAKGDTGAPGSALAYAHVNDDGTLDGTRSKGVTAVAKFPGTGVYCISFATAPTVLSVSLVGTGNNGQIASFYNPGTPGCNFNGKTYQVKVATADLGGSATDRSFDIVVN